MKIKIVFDSTIMYTPEEAEKFNVGITPFIIVINNESYKDMVDIDYKTFYEKLDEGIEVSTSQPNVADTIALFENILTEYDHIIYFTLPEQLSGTYNAGKLAAREVSEEKITVVDIATGVGASRTLALNVNKMIEENKTVEEIVEYSKSLKYNSKLYVVVRDTKQLRKSGRFSNMAASIFTMIKLKLALTLKTDGLMDKFSISRSEAKLLKEIVDDAQNMNFTEQNSRVYIAHANVLDKAKELEKRIKDVYPNIEVEYMPFPPTLGAHSGAGSYAAHFTKKDW
ncbi:DegV family protein [Mycoplasma sp. P36-A1]|uniref:DegV family protein n=1 Tax=Mycoplasma sp. P36-A1 TaxID=3252900 RepID=UPI003C308B48